MGTPDQPDQPSPSTTQPPLSSAAPHVAPSNRLIDSTSPYLLQHAHNPVDWYPWGDEALDRAKREQKPIFLSIGYSACHWCHVMEREVFEKHDIASIMNAHFINIKVDREERPDLDDLYMLATQLMSGSGGWPMSVWLTPDLEPFYAGTYFPPTDSYGRPGFPRLELALTDAWKNRRTDLEAQAQRVVEAIRIHADETATHAGAIDPPAWTLAAIDQFADRFDKTHGGLGSAPKFPPHQALQLWLALLANPEALSSTHQSLLRDMTLRTLDGMARGGIYDHVGGGFARYSTDDHWLVPHFEKMLYDSAQLAPVYALASALFERPDYARVARETLDFFLREMLSPAGAFFSSLDADSEGAEGKYYVWTLGDIHAAIPDKDDAALIIRHFGLTEHGNWHESPVPNASVLAVAPGNSGATTQDSGLPPPLIARLRACRALRARPHLDDKVLTSWNGLMISALAIAGRLLREPKYLEAAHRAIGFLLTRHMEGGRRLLRVSRDNHAHVDGFLDDHAFLLNGLLDLIDSTTPTSLPGTMARKRALELADTLIADFEDPAHGGFFYTSDHHEKLFARMKNAADNATPSANGVAIRALLRLARVSGKDRYRDVARRAIAAFASNIARRPEFFPTILLALVEDANAARAPLNLPLTPVPSAIPPQGASAALQLHVDPPPPLRPGDTFELRARLIIADGYHIQPRKPVDPEAFQTIARLRGDAELDCADWIFPPPHPVEGDALGYRGLVEFHARCAIPSTLAPGRYAMRLAVLAQPCSGTACLPPETVSTGFQLIIASNP
jgi:uncharacterized protein YyaL (SSP411 family)